MRPSTDHHRPRAGNRARCWRRLALWALVGGPVAWLAIFHLLLLRQRVSDLGGVEPATAMRWLGAFALLGGGLWLRRRGLSLLQGRSALVFWLLVVLLHAPPPVPAVEVSTVAAETRLARGLLPLLPLGVALASLRGLDPRALASRWRADRRRSLARAFFGVLAAGAHRAGAVRVLPALASRPPPSLSRP